LGGNFQDQFDPGPLASEPDVESTVIESTVIKNIYSDQSYGGSSGRELRSVALRARMLFTRPTLRPLVDWLNKRRYDSPNIGLYKF